MSRYSSSVFDADPTDPGDPGNGAGEGMPLKRSVSLAIHDPEGRLLLVQRPEDDEDLPLVWGLPAASLRHDESWGDAVRRAGADKLGVGVEPGRVLRCGHRDREGYRLEMRLYEATIRSGTPRVPQDVAGVTQYVALRWGKGMDLVPAARAGSLCSRLYLEAAAGTD